MKSKQFIQVPTKQSLKLININSIALLEVMNSDTKITLSVKDEQNKNVIIVAEVPYVNLSVEIIQMDNDLK